MPIRFLKKLGRKAPNGTAPETGSDDGKIPFRDLDLPEPLMRAIDDLGFEYCTPIQAEVLPHGIAGRNVAGQAQTGTGKTAAFLISMIVRFLREARPGKPRPGTPRALAIAPTRELVIQIERDAHALGRHTPLRTLAVYGGADFAKQEKELRSAPVDIVAATPGRLLDFCSRRIIDLCQVEYLVIDEADRMLDMGFIPDVRRIVRRLPPKDRRRTLLFSATLSEDVKRLALQWMPDPIYLEVEPDNIAVDTVDHLVLAMAARDKFKVLFNLLRKRPEMERVLVFGNRRDTTKRLETQLASRGVSCRLLSGMVDQKKRMRILEDFRAGKFHVLVATDVAGRGIHVDDITHVVNYDFPYEPEDYVHRIGRTGRAGAAGKAVSFACENESFIIPEIEKFIGFPLECRQPDEDLYEPVPRPTHRPPASGGEKEASADAERPRPRRRGRRSGKRSSGQRRR